MSIRNTLLATIAVVSLAGIAAQTASAQSTNLVQKENLSYLGSFKLPTLSGNGFSYGGTAIAINPGKNSLFVVGHVYDQLTAELSIPAMGGTATVIQSFKSTTGGRIGQVAVGSVFTGGNLVYKNRLYVTAFSYYDATGSQTLSHFNRPLDLSSSDVVGPYRVGSMGAGYYSGYMGLIPTEWQSSLGGPALTGNCCLSIISRTSYGPSVSSFDPEATAQSAKSLVYYDQAHQTLGLYGASGAHPVFNGTTRITGVFFPEGTASVLFFGSTGVGPYCYGEGSTCNDPQGAGKGEHAYPYKGYIWAYDAHDLAAVKSGAKQPWTVVPYATWEIPEMSNLDPDFSTGGAAYDPATKRVYLSQKYGDGDRPLIRVYEIGNSVPAKKPNAPSAVSAQ